MADQPVTIEKLINADIDVDNLGKAVNEDVVVSPRYGGDFKSLPMIAREYEENGATRGFNTLAEFEAVKATIPAYTVVTISEVGANQGQNVWDGTTLIKSAYDPLVQSKKFTSKSIIDFNNKIFTSSSNLFNDQTSVKENKLISASGEIVDSSTQAGWCYSDYIDVEPSGQYYVDGFRHYAVYDATKTFLGRFSVPQNSTKYFGTITLGENVYFIRLNYQTAANDILDGRKVNKGSVSIPYKPFRFPTLENVYLGDAAIRQIEEVYPQTANAHFHKSQNLFNHNTVTNNVVIRSTGEIEEVTTGYAVSDFIKVEPGQKYTMSALPGYNAFIHTAYYDVNKQFVSRNNTPTINGPLTITIPSGVHWIRFNINNGAATARNRMFNKDAVALPFEFWGVELRDVMLSQSILDQIEVNAENTINEVMLDLPIDNVYSTDASWTEFTDFRNVTSEQVYQMYDDLMSQHPEITKVNLGENSVGDPIAYYRFTPRRPNADVSTKIPKIFLLCGVHGMEHTPPLATFLMLREIYNNWQSNELLEALRFNVQFIVLPVANPDGWNRYNRVNPNGVDINRNWPEGWVLTSEGAFYSGPSPASELETQYAMQVFNENSDIDIFYDFHNFNGTNADTHPHFIWVSTNTADKHVQRMTQCLVGRMTRKWRSEYDFIPDPPYFAGYSTSNQQGGMAKNYARFAKNIKFCATLELGNRWWIDPSAVPYDTIHKRTAMEALTNWVLINLNELMRI